MRVFLSSLFSCCGFFDESQKETLSKDDMVSVTVRNIKDSATESPFRIKEIRQRSVDYVLHSPRFGGASLPHCTGGTDSYLKPQENAN